MRRGREGEEDAKMAARHGREEGGGAARRRRPGKGCWEEEEARGFDLGSMGGACPLDSLSGEDLPDRPTTVFIVRPSSEALAAVSTAV